MIRMLVDNEQTRTVGRKTTIAVYLAAIEELGYRCLLVHKVIYIPKKQLKSFKIDAPNWMIEIWESTRKEG